ncbi:FAD-binding oxidoreductase [Parasphingopyxis marina]|uniref:FAD-binding oxidoreductase n=1 Tax=Parasphingopyxis marina TaxID=2761622 RepID=A0A842I3V7_9SPHN|nr:FAD-binding oxidoreductase [Parasphingopyxis marina]MBC2778764.1 FAD-binding oxidoreductase [Parasphingopyxis marina]
MNSIPANISEHLQMSEEIIMPGSNEYEAARALYNAMLDKRPGCIVRCTNVDEVVATINYARDKDLLLAIRGGGHNGAGLGSCDGGLVLDTGAMKTITVDAEARTVSVEPGCTQGEVDTEASRYGLAVPAGIVSTTGIAGLTLGGGHGYLSRQYGLTIDNLIEAEVVLANGSIVMANENEHADLFWALRGGGGNFGVVTRFTFRAHPVAEVYAGPIFYDIAHAGEILRWYRDFLPTAPRKLSITLGIKTVPSTAPFPEEIWGRRICALIVCYNGSEEDGMAAMAAVREATPEPLMDGMMQMPFVAMQGLFDGLLPKGLQWYWKGDFVEEISDAAIADHIAHGSKSPSELSLMHLYPVDGAVHDVDAGETAWGGRTATWSMVIAGIDPDPAKAGALRDWAKGYWEAIHAHNRHGGAYVNFFSEDEDTARVKASYGDNYARLATVKRRYDPENLFRVNQNIDPKDAS